MYVLHYIWSQNTHHVLVKKLKDAKKDTYTWERKCFFITKTSGKLFKVTKFYMQSCATSTSVLDMLTVQQFTPNKYLIVYYTLTIYIQYTAW